VRGVPEEERHTEWAIMMANGDIIDEENPWWTEGDGLEALQRERKHLLAYGVGEVYLPILVKREIVMTTSSWEHTND